MPVFGFVQGCISYMGIPSEILKSKQYVINIVPFVVLFFGDSFAADSAAIINEKTETTLDAPGVG
jgi:hypothetical protein